MHTILLFYIKLMSDVLSFFICTILIIIKAYNCSCCTMIIMYIEIHLAFIRVFSI